MSKLSKTEIKTLAIAAVLVLAALFLAYVSRPTDETPSPTASPSPTSPPWWDSQPTYPTAPPAPDDVDVPTSLQTTLHENPITIGEDLRGSVTSNGRNYPITVYARHVGQNVETSFGAFISEFGDFYHSQPLNTAGYWDFWATTDTGVTSNVPRLTVEGANIEMSQTSFSRIMDDMACTVQLYCHSSGTATLFANDIDAHTSIFMDTVYINSGGYGATTFDFSGWSLGNYELDFIVNGIKASDYEESKFITLGR